MMSECRVIPLPAFSPRLLIPAALALLLLTLLAGWALGRAGAPAPTPSAAPAAAATLAGSDAPAAPMLELPVADPKAKEEKRFARADRDDDGRVTQAEYLVNRQKAFAKLDADGDGKLGFAEYATRGIEKFAEVDSDRNGALSAQEYAATAPKPRKKTQPCPAIQSVDVQE